MYSENKAKFKEKKKQGNIFIYPGLKRFNVVAGKKTFIK